LTVIVPENAKPLIVMPAPDVEAPEVAEAVEVVEDDCVAAGWVLVEVLECEEELQEASRTERAAALAAKARRLMFLSTLPRDLRFIQSSGWPRCVHRDREQNEQRPGAHVSRGAGAQAAETLSEHPEGQGEYDSRDQRAVTQRASDPGATGDRQKQQREGS
jgi:hypothetical protein